MSTNSINKKSKIEIFFKLVFLVLRQKSTGVKLIIILPLFYYKLINLIQMIDKRDVYNEQNIYRSF